MLGKCLQVDFQGLGAKFHASNSCLMLDYMCAFQLFVLLLLSFRRMLFNGVHHRRFDVRNKSVRRKPLHENISVRRIEVIRQE